MRTLVRDRVTVFYANPVSVSDQTDEFNNITGVPELTYGAPKRYSRLSAKKPSGKATLEPFGIATTYGDTFVTTDMCCPINEETRLWIGTCPYDSTNNLQPYTHLVKAVNATKNVIRIEVEEVSVS